MPMIFYIIVSFIIVFGLLGIYYIFMYNNLQKQIIRINEAENNIDEALRVKYDLLSKIIEIIKKETKVNSSEFKEFIKAKSDQYSNFEFDRLTNKINDLVLQIKKDYPKLNDYDGFKDLFNELKSTNEKISASKTYYNQHTTELNRLARIFPSTIVARIHHICCRAFFDNKNMEDTNNIDFKL